MTVVLRFQQRGVRAEMALAHVHAELAVLLEEVFAEVVDVLKRSRALTAQVRRSVWHSLALVDGEQTKRYDTDDDYFTSVLAHCWMSRDNAVVQVRIYVTY